MTAQEQSMQVVELTTEDQWLAGYPVMKQLRPHLEEAEYLRLLAETHSQGYRLLALYDEGRIVALAGFVVRTTLAHGRHIWVDDLVTDDSQRSRGYGQRLLAHVEGLAAQYQCPRVGLSSNFERTGAHRFYEEKMGYLRRSFTFWKSVNAGS